MPDRRIHRRQGEFDLLNEMRYVYAVYQEMSFSKAAKKMYISQPALSNMVRKAENEIGAPIFDRSTIPLTVTREGAYYIRSIEEILFIQRNIRSYFKDLEELNTGSLAIGGASFFCSFVFPELIGRFHEKYPNVTIDLLEGNVKELREGLEDETLDLVLETALHEGDPTVSRFFFRHETIILAVPAAYPVNKRLNPYRLSFGDVATGRFLSEQVEPVPLGVFAEVPFITMKPGNDMYERSIRMCRNAGFTPKIALLVDQVLTSINVASTGVGAVFIRSDIVGCRPENQELVYYKIGDPLARRSVTFASKKGKYITSAMREFMRMAGVKKLDEKIGRATGEKGGAPDGDGTGTG